MGLSKRVHEQFQWTFKHRSSPVAQCLASFTAGVVLISSQPRTHLIWWLHWLAICCIRAANRSHCTVYFGRLPGWHCDAQYLRTAQKEGCWATVYGGVRLKCHVHPPRASRSVTNTYPESLDSLLWEEEFWITFCWPVMFEDVVISILPQPKERGE